MAKKKTKTTREKTKKPAGPAASGLIPVERIDSSILLLRGEKVLLDADLAELYDVETRVLTQAVKRNQDRFPEDFMFQLNDEEFAAVKEHYGEKSGWGGRRYAPYAFTEQGVAMLSSVLRSDRAVQVNIEIMRAFVRIRQMLGTQEQLGRKLATMEKKYDDQFKVVFDAIRKMIAVPAKPKREIGFHAGKDES